MGCPVWAKRIQVRAGSSCRCRRRHFGGCWRWLQHEQVRVVISDVEHAVLDGTLNRGHVGKGERLSKGRLRKGRLRLRWNRRDVSDGTERCQHMPAYPSPVPSPSSSLESSIRRGIAKNNNEQHKTREGRDPTTAFLLLVPLQATVGTAGPGVSFRSRLSSPTALSSKPKQGDGVALAT